MTDDDIDAAAPAAALIDELVGMAVSDPLRDTVNAACFLGRQQDRAREIGQQLDAIGGFNLMFAAHRIVFRMLDPVTPNAGGIVRGLEMSWNGIGSWRD